MNKLTFAAVIVAVVCQIVSGHTRWKCPLPRDEKDTSGHHIAFDNTGNKYAACGPQSGKWGFGTVTTLKPGWTTLTWEESVNHEGSPFRIAILDETETVRAVLLDHIPHDDTTTPVETDESTYAVYKMSVNIPDIKCDKCSLQFLYVMTDKSRMCGIDTCYYNALDAACKGSSDPAAPTCQYAPNDIPCVAEKECFSNYHSCTDVIISGTKSFDQIALDSQPIEWPYKKVPMLYYGAEHADWSNGWLKNIPSNFTTQYPSLVC